MSMFHIVSRSRKTGQATLLTVEPISYREAMGRVEAYVDLLNHKAVIEVLENGTNNYRPISK